MLRSLDNTDLLVLFAVLFYLFCSPFTKVEESFNLQAIHDLLEIGWNLNYYDHLEFSGVVPRTFIGPLFVSIFSFPIYKLINIYPIPNVYNQILCRAILGLFSWISYIFFRDGVSFRFGDRVGKLTAIFLSLQFHLCFYMSRTLPNTFALIFCFFAFGNWLKGYPVHAIMTIAIAMVIFRCDLLVYLAPLVLQLLISKEIVFWRTLNIGILTVFISLIVTVVIDSIFWKYLLWSEGVVLFFNTVQNKSSEWGVYPFHWYFTNALTKSLNLTLFWIFCGLFGFKYPNNIIEKYSLESNKLSIKWLKELLTELLLSHGIDWKLVYYIFPTLLFVLLYSILPHKELRFIFSSIPIFTIAGAVGLDRLLPDTVEDIWIHLSFIGDNKYYQRNNIKDKKDKTKIKTKNNLKSIFIFILNISTLLTFLGMIFIASTILSASQHNYPGAVALDRLIHQHIPHLILESDEHDHVSRTQMHPVFVHIDASTAMTGVTRFLQDRVSLNGKKLYNNIIKENVNYLNSNPNKFNDTNFNFCKMNIDSNNCNNMDLVYYSKDENVTDYSDYTYLITSDPNPFIKNRQFGIVEEIKGFHKLKFSKFGYKVELKTILYILSNNH